MKKYLLILFLLCLLPDLSFGQNRTLFRIEQNGKVGFIDNTGKIIIKPQFDDGWGFDEGLAPVRVGSEWGFIDETGKIIIKPQFFEASEFVDGIASVGSFITSTK